MGSVNGAWRSGALASTASPPWPDPGPNRRLPRRGAGPKVRHFNTHSPPTPEAGRARGPSAGAGTLRAGPPIAPMPATPHNHTQPDTPEVTNARLPPVTLGP